MILISYANARPAKDDSILEIAVRTPDASGRDPSDLLVVAVVRLIDGQIYRIPNLTYLVRRTIGVYGGLAPLSNIR